MPSLCVAVDVVEDTPAAQRLDRTMCTHPRDAPMSEVDVQLRNVEKHRNFDRRIIQRAVYVSETNQVYSELPFFRKHRDKNNGNMFRLAPRHTFFKTNVVVHNKK